MLGVDFIDSVMQMTITRNMRIISCNCWDTDNFTLSWQGAPACIAGDIYPLMTHKWAVRVLVLVMTCPDYIVSSRRFLQLQKRLIFLRVASTDHFQLRAPVQEQILRSQIWPLRAARINLCQDSLHDIAYSCPFHAKWEEKTGH